MVVDALHRVLDGSVHHAHLDRPSQPGHGGDVPPFISQGHQDGVAALGVPGTGVRKRVVQDVQDRAFVRDVSRHRVQPGPGRGDAVAFRYEPGALPASPASARQDSDRLAQVSLMPGQTRRHGAVPG
ncbi:hypothetical protein ACFFX0_01495 [Citricoccus parietis]|uniref:Uncharacterized protein n=1 Tax=Citricoccus parietis TaxID=592307 RepID=A0ABV5FTD0_9MICC